MRAANVSIVNLDNVPNNMVITRPTPGASVQTLQRNGFRSHSIEATIRTRIYVYLIGPRVAASPQELRRMIASAGGGVVDQVLSLLTMSEIENSSHIRVSSAGAWIPMNG